MAFVYADRVKETTQTAGMGPLTLLGAQSGFQSFGSVMSVGDTANYVVVDNLTGMWEVGVGTYSATNTLTRTTILSSSSANFSVNFLANVKDVFIDVPASVIRTLLQPAGNTGAAAPTLYGTTTSVSSVRLTSDGNAPGPSNTLNLLTPQSLMRVTGTLLAKQISPTLSDSASWDVTFVIRADSLGNVSLVNAATAGGILYTDPSMAGCVFQPIAADTVNKGISLTVTGVTGATILWTFIASNFLKV